MDDTELLTIICDHLSTGDIGQAESILARNSPFAPIRPLGRSYRLKEMVRVFRRDGFVDRYSGKRLIFPGTLRLISLYLPRAFPYHPNWRTTDSHFAFWKLSPTVDHVVPVSRGGEDDLSNLVTTSQLRNSAKGNWLLAELGWELHSPGDLAAWDGLTGWFHRQLAADPTRAKHPAIRRWLAATRGAVEPC
jgi:5-methylcytosine-specific restriction endonuclease McrA